MKKIGWQKPPTDNNLNSRTNGSEYNLTAVGRTRLRSNDGQPQFRVYFDMLQPIFTQVTGLYTCF